MNSAGLSAITGALVVVGVAASSSAAFHHAMLDHVQAPQHAPRAHILLESVYPGERQVYADIISESGVILGGAIQEVSLPPRYTGLLNVTIPVWPGDMLPVVIRHANGEHAIQVRVR